MEIDISTVAVGTTVMLSETEFISMWYSRHDERSGMIEHYNPEGLAVLLIDVDLTGREAPCELCYIDHKHYTVTLNGDPVTPGEHPGGSYSVNDELRTIEIINVENHLVS